MNGRAGIVIVVVFLSISSFPLLSQNTEAVSTCPGRSEITIQIAQPKQTAYVAPGQDGIVTFTGTVFAQIFWDPDVKYLVVTLTPDAGEWVVSNPQVLIFTKAQKQQSFIITVKVPTGTSKTTHGQLSVSGIWNYSPVYGGGEIPPATAIIVVDQFDQVEIDPPKGYIRIKQGQDIQTHVKIHNRGNGNGRFRAFIENEEELEGKGWEIEYGPDKMSIPENDHAKLNLGLRSSENIELGLHRIKIGVIFANAYCQDPFVFEHVIFVEVEDREILGIKMGTWLAFAWAQIILMSLIVSFVIMTRRKLTWI